MNKMVFQFNFPKRSIKGNNMGSYSIKGGLADKITNGRQKYKGFWKQTIRCMWYTDSNNRVDLTEGKTSRRGRGHRKRNIDQFRKS